MAGVWCTIPAMDLLKSITGKIVTGIVVLVVIACAIWWWTIQPDQREVILSSVGRVGAWIGIVLLLPWALFWVIRWVAGLESNLAGALLVIGLTVMELVGLAWLFDWRLFGDTVGWVYLILGLLIAGVYNLFTCDWIAERFE